MSRPGSSAAAAAAPRAAAPAAAAPVAAQVMYAPSYFYGNKTSTGTKDDPTATDFLTTCTSLLQSMTHITTDAEKIRFIASNLRGKAATWWSTQMTVHHDEEIQTDLKVFRQQFAKRFWCHKYLAGDTCTASASLTRIHIQKNLSPFDYWEELSSQIFRMASLEEHFTSPHVPEGSYCDECPPIAKQDRHLAVRGAILRVARQAWLAGLTPGSEWSKAARAAINNGFPMKRVVEEADQAYRNIMPKTKQHVRAVEEQDDTDGGEHEVAAFKNKGKGKKSKVTCAYCKIRGHVEADCRRKKNGVKPPSSKKPSSAAPVSTPAVPDDDLKALADKLGQFFMPRGTDQITAVQQPSCNKAHF